MKQTNPDGTPYSLDQINAAKASLRAGNATAKNESARLSENQIRRRLDVIAPHTKWIRSFSCTEGNELIPEMAHQKGLKTLVGAWISDDRERNEKEIH
jgi:exo-beta-1,3-glucanase (GH17 family)